MDASPRRLFGRRQILTSATEITRENVVHEVVEKAYLTHLKNRDEINYLYEYYKGNQPILYRLKEIRPEICNTVVENHAQEIIAFKTGYLCGSPIQYISRNAEDNVSESVAYLNDMMLSRSKASKDKELIEWDGIAGTAYRMVLPVSDDEDAPFDVYTLDPRDAFVIYNNGVERRPVAGVYYVTDDDWQINHFSVYTPNEYFEIQGNKIVNQRPLSLGGMIPIIEYPANNSHMGAFEPVIPLLDAINEVDSNRLDGVEQFIQSLIVLYNCELDEGENANTIRANGLITLKSIGENKADIKVLAEQLNQTETQTLKDDMYQMVLTISGVPSQGNGNTGDSSNNGAVILRQGWEGAEARAKDSELMFKQSEEKFLKLVLFICKGLSKLELKVSDVEAHFTRRNYENLLSKSQVLVTMLAQDKIAPKLAFEASGLFIDSEEAYRESMAWWEEHKNDATTTETQSYIPGTGITGPAETEQPEASEEAEGPGITDQHKQK